MLKYIQYLEIHSGHRWFVEQEELGGATLRRIWVCLACAL